MIINPPVLPDPVPEFLMYAPVVLTPSSSGYRITLLESFAWRVKFEAVVMSMLVVIPVETPDDDCGRLNVIKLSLFKASKVTANLILSDPWSDTKYLLSIISFPWLSVNPIPEEIDSECGTFNCSVVVIPDGLIIVVFMSLVTVVWVTELWLKNTSSPFKKPWSVLVIKIWFASYESDFIVLFVVSKL